MNGSCWQALLGGVFDKVFNCARRPLDQAETGRCCCCMTHTRPLPDWASYTNDHIETNIGSISFAGSASQHEDFSSPANGDYIAKADGLAVAAGLSCGYPV